VEVERSLEKNKIKERVNKLEKLIKTFNENLNKQ